MPRLPRLVWRLRACFKDTEKQLQKMVCLLPLRLLHVPPSTHTFALASLHSDFCTETFASPQVFVCVPPYCLPIASLLCFYVSPSCVSKCLLPLRHMPVHVCFCVSTLLVRVSSHSDTCQSYFCFPLYSLFLSTVFAERTTCHSDTSLLPATRTRL